MKNITNLHFVQSSDWVAVYDNDVLIFQNHSMSAEDLLSILEIPFKISELDREIAEQGMPEDLNEIKDKLSDTKEV